MSKGPGRVERQLAEIFRKRPKGSFSTRELCCKVFGSVNWAQRHLANNG